MKTKTKIKTIFFLARHGETEWNKQRRLQGHLNSKLTENGLSQAKALAENIYQKNIELIISSPLERALNTAQVVQQKLNTNLLINDNLVERHFGDWQGTLFDDLSEQQYFEQIFFQVTKHAPPDGESGLDCAKRIASQMKLIAQQKQESKILIVTHGDAIRCFLSSLQQKSQCDAYSQYGNGKFFVIEFQHNTKQFTLLN